MAVASGQIDAIGSAAERIDDKRIAKPHSLARQPIKVWRLKPGKAGFIALLALHDAERVPTLVVGVDEEEIRPIGGISRSKLFVSARRQAKANEAAGKRMSEGSVKEERDDRKSHQSAIVRCARGSRYARSYPNRPVT